MTPPDPTTTTDPQNPTPGGQPGQTDPASQPQDQKPEDKPAGDTTPPAKIEMTQAELDAKFGTTRTEGKLAMAKAAGFDTIAAFEAAAADFKKYQDDKKTDAQRQADRDKENQRIMAENQSLKLERAAERTALQLGADPKRVDAILRLRDASDADFAEGTVNAEAVKTSIEKVLTDFPEFKAGATKIGTGSNPASGAAEAPSIDLQIQEAQKKGDIDTVIELQMQKLQAPA